MESRSPQDYFDTGMALLATGGVGAVTIARLCGELGVTKGSFYHHFRGVEDFRSQLLAHWAAEGELQLLSAAASEPNPVRRLDVIRELGVAMNHEAEVAIRAWSRVDSEAWSVREKVDAARERMVASAYQEVGVPADVASLLGRLAVAVLVGAQHRAERTDRDALREIYSHLQEMTQKIYLASPPKA